MGSHGSATAPGQAAVLAHYGITEASMGCPVLSQLDVVPLGTTPQGIEVFLDKLAAGSDGIMLVSRVKWHTDFSGKIESGLYKMMAIGLGKFAGAQKYHTWAKRIGLEEVVRSVGRRVLQTGKIIGGLAIVEDAYHQTARVEAVPAAGMETREPELLAMAKEWAGRLPFDIDILIIDEMGKDISGTGFDTRIVNRTIGGAWNPWPNTPQVRRIFVRDLSRDTYGNAVGIGMADIITDRLLEKVDWDATRVNVLTAGNPAGARIPLHWAADRDCLEALAPGAGCIDPRDIHFGWIRNTLELRRIALSENLREQIEANPLLEIDSEPFEMPFQADGNLCSPFATADVGAVA
jgi:hypothetical protein